MAQHVEAAEGKREENTAAEHIGADPAAQPTPPGMPSWIVIPAAAKPTPSSEKTDRLPA
jgi:hypothetical protein